jgi:hypothetical protein
MAYKYTGFLSDHRKRIKQLARKGHTPMEIARVLFAEGARTPNSDGPDRYMTDAEQIRSMYVPIRNILDKEPLHRNTLLRLKALRRRARAERIANENSKRQQTRDNEIK